MEKTVWGMERRNKEGRHKQRREEEGRKWAVGEEIGKEKKSRGRGEGMRRKGKKGER